MLSVSHRAARSERRQKFALSLLFYELEAFSTFPKLYFFFLYRWGSAFIYPVLDWSKPEQTLVVATLTALFLGLMHLLTVAIASLRDVISRRCLRESTGVYNDGFDA